MQAADPAPVLVADGAVLWLAYRIAREDDHYAIIRFDGVRDYRSGPPGAERLREHPLARKGLAPGCFYEVLQPTLPADLAAAGYRRWIATFPEETVEVTARGARVEVRATEAVDGWAAVALLRA